MVPTSFFNLYIASTGAGATLVGLLFVAISIAPEHVLAESAPAERQIRATSAFTALFNAFFVSLVALIPYSNLGGVGLTMGAIGLINSTGIAVRALHRQRGWRSQARGAGLLIASFVLYGLQSWYSVALLRNYRDVDAVFVIAFLMIVAYGIGLSRAWELLGAHRVGLSSLIGLILTIGARDPKSTARTGASLATDDGATATNPHSPGPNVTTTLGPRDA